MKSFWIFKNQKKRELSIKKLLEENVFSFKFLPR